MATAMQSSDNQDPRWQMVTPEMIQSPPTQPAQPAPSTSAPAEGSPQPDAAGQSAEPTSGELPVESEGTEAIRGESEQEPVRRDRPYVARLQRQLGATQAEATALKAQVAYLMQQLQGQQAAQQSAQPSPQPQVSTPGAKPKPRHEDYGDNTVQFWEDLTAWKAEQLLEAREQQRAQYQQQQEQEYASRIWAQRVHEARNLYEDFDETVSLIAQYVPQSQYPVIERAIVAIPNGAALMVHLLQHPTLLEEVAERQPAHAFRYLQRLAESLTKGPSAGQPPQGQRPTVPQTPAPPPVRPLTGAGQVPMTRQNSAEIAEAGGSFADYHRQRQAELAARQAR